MKQTDHMESILLSVKKMVGVPADVTEFDLDLIMHINSVFLILNQLGVGPTTPFVIYDEKSYWLDLELYEELEIVKSYMYAKVRLLFDPPSNSAHIQLLQQLISELEWRLNVAVDPK